MLLFLTRAMFSRKSRTARPPAPPRAKTNKVRPTFEQLEDRSLMSVSYFSFPSGTWAYDHYNGSSRKITAAQPKVMSSNGSSLYAGYNSGTFAYNYDNNAWTKLSSAVPVAIGHGAPTLYVSYNTGTIAGTWQYANSTWKKLSNQVALQIAAVGPGICHFAFGGGLRTYEEYANRWTNVKLPAGTTNLYKMAVSGSCLVVGLNTGTYQTTFSGGWQKVANGGATQIAMLDTNDYYLTVPSGTYRCTNGKLVTKFDSTPARAIGAGSSGYHQPVFIGSWSGGTWTWQNGQWKKISNAVATVIA